MYVAPQPGLPIGLPHLGMAAVPPLTEDEEALLGHYRRLKRHYKEWTLTVVGQFRSGRQQVRLRPCPDVVIPTGLTEEAFEAID